MKVSDFKWHQLDPSVGGYMSCRIGESSNLKILTTPISTAPRDAHRLELLLKIKQLKQ